MGCSTVHFLPVFTVTEKRYKLSRREIMSEIDWAKLYAKMDERLALKYQQLPKGEQVGKRDEIKKLGADASEPRKRALGFSLNK